MSTGNPLIGIWREELKNGTIDAIWNGYTATDERKEKVAFTIPYMENQQVLVSKKSQKIHSVQDMTDKVLGGPGWIFWLFEFWRTTRTTQESSERPEG